MKTVSFGTAFPYPAPASRANMPAQPLFGAAPVSGRDQLELQGDIKQKREKAKPSTLKGFLCGTAAFALSLIPAILVGVPLTIIGLPAGGIPAIPGLVILASPIAIGPLGYVLGKYLWR